MDFKTYCSKEYMRKIKGAYTDDIIYSAGRFAVVDRYTNSGNLSVIVKSRCDNEFVCNATIDSVYSALRGDKISYADFKEILTAFKAHDELCYSY